MNTEITTRHCNLPDSVKDRAEARLNKLQRYFDRILDARIVLNLERNRYHAEAILSANGTPLTSHAVADNEHVAIEQVIDKLEVQVRRHKDRLKRRNKGAVTPMDMEGLVEVEEEIEDPFDESDLRGLVSEDAGEFHVRMSVAEAAAQIRVSKREVLGFTNQETGRPTLLYKRRDGNVGVVDVHLD